MPRTVARHLVLIGAVAGVSVSGLAVRTTWRYSDIIIAAVFLLSGGLSIEVFRHIAAPHRRGDRPYQDLLGAFLFPAAVLLPPVYAALMVLPLNALLQARGTRLSLPLRVSNASAGILVCVGAAVAHDAFVIPLAHERLHDAFATSRSLAGLFVAAFVYLVLDRILTPWVVERPGPGMPWRAQWLDPESWILGLSEVCAGMVVMLVWMVSPPLILFALVPFLLLQRAVVHSHLVASSRHDAKTGLANTSWWRHEAGRAVRRSQHGGESVAVVVVDLDRFKAVNDRYGHLAGDTVLATVADTLRVVVRPGDMVGRFGGDEFTVLLIGTNERQAMGTAERLCDRLATTIRQSLPAVGLPLGVTASLGVAVFKDAGVELDDLIRAADGAMYQAKATGGNCVRLATAAP